jgi:signal peptidase I
LFLDTVRWCDTLKVMIRGIIVTFLIIFVILILITPVFYTFFGFPIWVSGKEMAPNINNGEFILVDKFSYKNELPKRGDVIIFKNSEGQTLVRRIVGMPGESLSFLNGGVYINDQLLDESHLHKDTITTPGPDIEIGEHFQIPKESYFVLNDNRVLIKNDSRQIGVINKESILGKYWVKIY